MVIKTSKRSYDMHVKLDETVRGICLCPTCDIPNFITVYKGGTKSFCPKCGKYQDVGRLE